MAIFMINCGVMELSIRTHYFFYVIFKTNWARVQYPDLGQNLGFRAKFESFSLNLGLFKSLFNSTILA